MNKRITELTELPAAAPDDVLVIVDIDEVNTDIRTKKIKAKNLVLSVYTETPAGAIDGVNDVFTVENTIHNIFSFAINGQFIHPGEYEIVDDEIHFDQPLDASFNGLPFTIVYN